MQRMISNQACKLYHTVYCDMLNMPSCEQCFVNERSDPDQIISDLDVLRSLLPEEGTTHLFTDEECQFCKGQRNKRAYYAMLDMGHAEPSRSKRTAIGIKTKTKIGSMLPVQISACADCRKRIRTLDNLPLLLPLIVAAVVLIALMFQGVNNALTRVHPILPFLVFVVAVLISVLLGRIIETSLRKKYGKLTVLNPLEIPTLARMVQRGWFPLSGTNPKKIKLIFTKRRMRMGVGTGTREEAFCVTEQPY